MREGPIVPYRVLGVYMSKLADFKTLHSLFYTEEIQDFLLTDQAIARRRTTRRPTRPIMSNCRLCRESSHPVRSGNSLSLSAALIRPLGLLSPSLAYEFGPPDGVSYLRLFRAQRSVLSVDHAYILCHTHRRPNNQ